MMPRTVTLRDPIWDTIRLDECAVRIVDSPSFQRLRYIKQLGHAHLVYPGATHTRFDHALGVYHLSGRALAMLGEKGTLDAVPQTECRLIPFAGLLHDIGHYPFSHAVEELEPSRIPGDHEKVAGHFIRHPDIAGALASLAANGPERLEALIQGQSDNPLQGLVSGSLDLDKIEYLRRDARFCGVPYGEVDVDRLLHALALLPAPETGRLEVGVAEKGVAALESLLFSKYQMFRNVYWHHAVRAATAMYKRVVVDALDAELFEPQELLGNTDEGLLHLLELRSGGASTGSVRQVSELLRALRERDLPKRAGEVVAAELPDAESAEWLATDTPLKRRVEERIAEELKVSPGAAYLDYPAKSAMFGLDLLVQRNSGEVQRLGPSGAPGLIGLPQVSEALYRTARVLRVFTSGGRRSIEPRILLRIGAMGAQDMENALGSTRSILG